MTQDRQRHHDVSAAQASGAQANADELPARALEQHQAAIAGLTSELERVGREQEAAEAAATAFDETLQLRASEVERLQRDMAEGEIARQRLQRQLEEALATADRNKRLLNEVKRSRSWRLTAPFRRIGLFGRREKRILRRQKENPSNLSGQVSRSDRHPGLSRSSGSLSFRIGRLPTGREGTAAPQPGSKHLVCVSHVLPYPPCADGEFRIHRMLTWLRSAGWSITLVVAPLPGRKLDAAAVTVLTKAYPDLVVVHRDGRIDHQLSSSAAALEALDGRRVEDPSQLLGETVGADRLLDLERSFAHDGLVAAVRALVDGVAPQVLLVDHLLMTRLFPAMPAGLLKLVDTYNVFSAGTRTMVRCRIRDDLVLDGAEAARLLSRADLVVAVQPGQQRELERIAQGGSVVMAGVDFDIAADLPQPPGRVILLVASDHVADTRGFEDFLEFAWPIIGREVPEAELWIAGPVGGTVDIDGRRVRQLGPAGDLATIYAEASVVISPAVTGGGFRFETVEALGRLRPVVTWPSGVDGLDSRVRALCEVVDSWYAFAEAVVRHLGEERTLTAGQRDLLAGLFSAERAYSALDQALAARIGDRTAAG